MNCGTSFFIGLYKFSVIIVLRADIYRDIFYSILLIIFLINFSGKFFLYYLIRTITILFNASIIFAFFFLLHTISPNCPTFNISAVILLST